MYKIATLAALYLSGVQAQESGTMDLCAIDGLDERFILSIAYNADGTQKIIGNGVYYEEDPGSGDTSSPYYLTINSETRYENPLMTKKTKSQDVDGDGVDEIVTRYQMSALKTTEYDGTSNLAVLGLFNEKTTEFYECDYVLHLSKMDCAPDVKVKRDYGAFKRCWLKGGEYEDCAGKMPSQKQCFE